MKKVVSIILTLSMLIGVVGVSTCFATNENQEDFPNNETIFLLDQKEELSTLDNSNSKCVGTDKEKLSELRKNKIFKIINGEIILILGAVSFAALKYIKDLKGQIANLEKHPDLTLDNCLNINGLENYVLEKNNVTAIDCKTCENNLKDSNKIYEIYKPLLNAISEKWQKCVIKGICINIKPEVAFNAAMDMYMNNTSSKNNEK